MTLPRRDFLRTTCGLGIGTAAAELSGLARAAVPAAQAVPAVPQLNEYERILATTKALNYLGRPRSWSVVQQGFLPLSPERVIILQPWHPNTSFVSWGHYPDERRRVLERLNAGISDYEKTAAERGVSPTKVDLILRITENFARYYSVPAYWPQWAYWLTVREATGSSASCGFGMAHQFQYQPDQTIGTTNAQVDWWLVLIPGGTKDWDSLDGEPVHVVVAHVFSVPHSRYPGDSLRVWECSATGLRSFADTPAQYLLKAAALSKMDRVSAARLFNQHVISALPTCPAARV